MTPIEVNRSRLLAPTPHGFLGRRGGASVGTHAGLNVGLGSADDPAAVAANRVRATDAVAPGARGRGIASDALRALVLFAWTLPGLHRVELHIEPWNAASLGVARRVGFSYEGLLAGYMEIGGRRRDLASYAVIRTAPPETVRPPAAGMPTAISDGRPTSAP